jgi:lysyl-tRNA synthetase class 2
MFNNLTHLSKQYLCKLCSSHAHKVSISAKYTNQICNSSRYLSKFSDSNPTSSKNTSVAPSQSSDHKEHRLRDLAALESLNLFTPHNYPNDFSPSHSLAQFTQQFSHLTAGARQPEIQVKVAARITAKREASSKLIFYTLSSGQDDLQIMVNARTYTENFQINKFVRVGDIIGVHGFPGATNTGQLSVLAERIDLLTPCLHEIPQKLTNPDTRFRQKYLDLLVNREQIANYVARSKITQILRDFLVSRGFLEVETPILWPLAGGALAKPFETSSFALGKHLPLYLRVSPELFLKQLIISGVSERVFELGKVFRNEGIDQTHNPEFSMLELYQSYAHYGDFMQMTQELLREIVKRTQGTTKINVTSESGEKIELDFGENFAKIDIWSELHAQLGVKELPDPNDDRNLPFYVALCSEKGVTLSEPLTLPRILDKLIGQFIENNIVQPTFLLHHPVIMSPLAREMKDRKGFTERFELFILGKEYANAYSELNHSATQRERFTSQSKAAEQGDSEAMQNDAAFVEALEYGLPPTAGFGLGIDRLVMLLNDKNNIRDVIFFPVIKPKQHQQQHTTESSDKK